MKQTGNSNWLEIVIKVLRWLIAILSAVGGATAVASGIPGTTMAARAMSEGTWLWVLLGVLAIAGVLTWVFETWRQGRQDNEDKILDQVLDFVQWILESLKEETGKRLRDIPQATVEAAARQVYREFLADTPLAFVPEDVFTGMVVEYWRKVAGVGSTVRLSAVQTRVIAPSG